MTNITITVNKSFGTGTQEIGLDDYVEAFTWGLSSLGILSNNTEEFKELEAMQKRVKDLAVKKFFKIYGEDQEKANTNAALLAASA